MRCAIVHYWLLGMRGGEAVVEAVGDLLPNADIFTLFYDPKRVSASIRSHRVTVSSLNLFRGIYRTLLPAMPIALESFDLREYDLIISSESGPAKGVITSSNARHICYCHSPMRYLWDLYPAYLNEWTPSSIKRGVIALFAHYLRMWDYASAARVDEFIANSVNVQQRIWKAYRRRSDVIYPPVEVESFYRKSPQDYYLVVSELVEYKRIADAVRCFSRFKRPLKIVGDGPEYGSLKRMAGPETEFCGRVSAAELKELYACCRAVVMPGEEDFGMVPVEAMASGKPVVALGRGGVLESVPQREPRAGFFYEEPGDESLERAVRTFECEESSISPAALQIASMRFSADRFRQSMRDIIFGEDERTCFTKASHSANDIALTRP